MSFKLVAATRWSASPCGYLAASPITTVKMQQVFYETVVCIQELYMSAGATGVGL